MALIRAIRGGGRHRIVWSSLMNPRSYRDLVERGYDVAQADGYIDLLLTRTAVTNSICAWSFKWLREVGFIKEPQKWYGGLEAEMWGSLRRTDSRWAFLPQWRETDELRDLHDKCYIGWKWRYAHLRDTALDFEAWLVAKGFDLKTGLHPDPSICLPDQIP